MARATHRRGFSYGFILMVVAAALWIQPPVVAGETQRTARADQRSDGTGSTAIANEIEPAPKPPWTTRNAPPLDVEPDAYNRFGAQLLGDFDTDGVDDLIDNCVFDSNSDQADADGDLIGDVCDSCSSDFEPRVPWYAEDFETGAPGWTHAVFFGTAADTWNLTDIACFNQVLGSTMYVSNGNAGPGCVIDSSRENSRLLSPRITLPAAGQITLSLDVLAFDELGSCIASGDFDAKDLGITVDGGQSYTLLNDCFPLTGVRAPVHHDFDITAFAGQTIQVIFVYDTLDDQNQDTFAVDNVTITSNAGVELNSDGDLVGDVCDVCPIDADNDIDGDLLCADVDNCPDDFNPLAISEMEDFETGAVGWTHAVVPASGEPPADTWHLTDTACFATPLGSTMFVSDGNAGAGCVEQSSRESSRLLSPVFNLPGSAPSIALSFDAISYDERGSCLSSGDFDAKDVGITTNGGASYTALNDNPCVPLVDVNGVLLHREFDITAFAGQAVQVIFVYDTQDLGVPDGDHTFAVDNVAIIAPQVDFDVDGTGDPCDCLPSNGSIWAAPDEVLGLSLLPDKVTLEWSPATGSVSSGFEVLRGDIADLPVGAGVGETCVDSVVLPSASDAAVPSVGEAFYYAVRGVNTCGEGTYGFASSEDERVSTACP